MIYFITAPGGGGGGGIVVNAASINLAVNFSVVATAPIYATLLTLGLTTELPSSYLKILFSAAALHTGGSAANGAVNVRFRLNGVLIAPGGGCTFNDIRNRIQPLVYTRRLVVAAGLQTVDVEISLFGAVGNSISISTVGLPDLVHAHLELQEMSE